MKKFIETKHGMIHILIENPEQETGCIFIHGNSLSSATWQQQIEAPAFKNYAMIALDLPGHGKSAKESGLYDPSVLVDVVKELVSQLNYEKYVVAGHSLGGNMAIEVAEKLPGLAGLFLVATPPLSKPMTPDVFMPVMEVQYAFMADISEEQAAALAGKFTNNSKTAELLKEQILATDPQFREKIAIATASGNYEDETEILKRLSVPVAMVLGDEDPLVNGEFVKKLEVKNLWRNEFHSVASAGHCVQMDNVEGFNALLGEFLKEII